MEHYSNPFLHNTFNKYYCELYLSVSHYKIQILECPTVLLIQLSSHLSLPRLITSIPQMLPLHQEMTDFQQLFPLLHPKTVSYNTSTLPHLGQTYIRKIRYTAKLCRTLFLSDPLLPPSLWLYIPFLRSVFTRCIGHLGLFTFSVLEDSHGEDMTVPFITNSSDYIIFQLLRIFNHKGRQDPSNHNIQVKKKFSLPPPFSPS